MNITKQDTIGSVVAQDYRTASVFEQYGIDFCCNGNRSIEEACKEKNIAEDVLMNAVLHKAGEPKDGNTAVIDYNSWPLDLLADYIEKKHHRYVTAQIPVLKNYLDKICSVHGAAHPELFEIKELFDISAGEFTMHMKKEELMLFPFIKKMAVAAHSGAAPATAPFGTVQSPIRVMMHEHDGEGERFRKIAMLSNNYTPPADACNTYKVTLATLREFEDDLHLHIHLENNILFPKAIELENSFK